MSNKLGGKQGTAYLGTNANQPPNWTFSDRDPTQYDVNNISLGDMWLNQDSENVWILVSLSGDFSSKGSLATWSKIEAGGINALNSLTGNTGGVVNPDINDNINIIGDGISIAVAGNPATNTLTISAMGGQASSFATDSGSATPSGGVLNIIAGKSTIHSGSSVSFSGSGNTVELNVTDSNLNTIIGIDAGNATISGTDNTALGTESAELLTTGSQNVFVGFGTGAIVTSGSNNTIIGATAGPALSTGTNNTFLGATAGSAYASSESNNILINAPGTLGESNALHIGAGTGTSTRQLNKAFISGIVGITPATADGIPVFIGSTGQLGTVGTGGSILVSTLTGNAGGAVGPSAGNINIVGDGTTIQITGNPGTNTLTVVGLGGGGGDLSILTGDSGSATASGGTINVITNNSARAAGSSVLFTGTSNTLTLSVTDSNNNTMVGSIAGTLSMSGTHNTALGDGAAASISTGNQNVVIGSQAGHWFTTGSNNTLLGYEAGNNYTTGSESNNINIGSPGVNAESNVLRIGAATGSGTQQLNKTFIAGIRGITPTSADGIPVFIGSTGQLGTVGTGGTSLLSTLTGNTGGALSPVAGNINVVGDATTINIAGTGNTLTASVVTGSTFVQTVSGNTGGALSPSAGNVIIEGDGTTISIAGSGHTLIASLVGTGAIQTLTGSTSGGAISPLAGNVNITAGSGITVVGTPNTLTISATAVDAYTNVNSSPYVVLTTDQFLSVDCSGGPIIIQLPNAASIGKIYYIKDRTGSSATNNITVRSLSGAVNIDGATTFVMNTAYQAISIIGNGSTYEIF